MVLVFVATLEQVRVGIRGAQAEFFESCMVSGTTLNSFGEENCSTPSPSHSWWVFAGRVAYS